MPTPTKVDTMVLRYCGHCRWKNDLCFELYSIRGVRSVNDCPTFEESEYSKFWRIMDEKKKSAEKEAAPGNVLQSSFDKFFME